MQQRRLNVSLEGKLSLAGGAAVAAAVVLAVWLYARSGSWWLSSTVTLAVAVPLVVYLLHRVILPVNRIFGALRDGVSSLRDEDYSVSIATDRRDELGELVGSYNTLTEVLRGERQNLMQRELMLDTVIQTTPLALVLTGAGERVLYSNTAARELFGSSARFEGHQISTVLAEAPAELRAAAERGVDGLFVIDDDGETETFHVSVRTFHLNAQMHNLYLFKRLTREMNRQEVMTWKKVIRVIAHELNNSLAPISSLANSGKLVAKSPDPEKLQKIFGTIEERAAHLNSFIDGYASFAKLPQPRRADVGILSFLESLRRTVPFALRGDVAGLQGFFDAAQIEQVLINLLKNSHESGSAEEAVEIAVETRALGISLRVLDRGSGMSDTVMHHALLPFYSTKRSGTGLGLPLCREIVEAHGGRLNLANRSGGGLSAEIWLPGRESPQDR